MTRRRAAQAKVEGGTFLRVSTADVYGGVIAGRGDRAAQGELAELAASIARHGLLQPIVVRAGAQAGRYALVCGARRLAACRMLGVREIDARLIEGDDAEAAACFMEEHLTRNPTAVIEEARAAARVGETRLRERFALPWRLLARRLRLLTLGEEVCALAGRYRLTLEQTEPLLAVADGQLRLEAASVIAARALTGGQAWRLVFGGRVLPDAPVRRRAVREALGEAQRLAARLSRQGVPCSVALRTQEKGICVQILLKTGETSPPRQEINADEENKTPTVSRRARRAQPS